VIGLCQGAIVIVVALLQGHNIFMNLSSAQYSDMMSLLKHAILAAICLSVRLSVRSTLHDTR